MTTLCFYQGLHTIGGTVVEIATEQARCLFDFGFAGNPQLDPRVAIRPKMLVSDLLRTAALPPVPGLYSRAELGTHPLAAYGETDPQPFVIISHMHIDHMGALGMLADDVDVYMSKESLLLYRGLRKIKDIYARPHRNVYGVTPMKWRVKGDISFRMIPVDHDVPGACAFEITTPDGRICYTGDLRIHGSQGERSVRFADTVRHADVCITEGTTVSFTDDYGNVTPDSGLTDVTTEIMAEQEIISAVREQAGMTFINLYNRNIRRIHGLLKGIRSVGKRLVLQYNTAVLYRQFYPSEHLDIAAVPDGKREIGSADYIAKSELLKHPHRFALEMPLERLLDTLDYDAASSLYIHAEGAPLGAYDPAFTKLQEFLAAQGIEYRLIHCGGHAAPSHLRYLLHRIAPNVLVPLHSLTPEKIIEPGAKRLLPEAGKRYRLTGGILIGEK